MKCLRICFLFQFSFFQNVAKKKKRQQKVHLQQLPNSAIYTVSMPAEHWFTDMPFHGTISCIRTMSSKAPTSLFYIPDCVIIVTIIIIAVAKETCKLLPLLIRCFLRASGQRDLGNFLCGAGHLHRDNNMWTNKPNKTLTVTKLGESMTRTTHEQPNQMKTLIETKCGKYHSDNKWITKPNKNFGPSGECFRETSEKSNQMKTLIQTVGESITDTTNEQRNQMKILDQINGEMCQRDNKWRQHQMKTWDQINGERCQTTTPNENLRPCGETYLYI